MIDVGTGPDSWVVCTHPACAEQDLHQPPPGHALEAATRTRPYQREIGLG